MPLDFDSSTANALSKRYLAVSTSNVSDVLDELGLADRALAPEFTPFPASAGKLAGWAFTIRGESTRYPLEDGDPTKMEACAALNPGSVSVWSGGGAGSCSFGELIALGMQERGCVGALVDGGVRDVDWIGQLQFPVFARYRSPVQSIGRWKVVAYGEPVPIPGATVDNVMVSPGDFVLADSDGAIVVPRAAAEHVLERAEELEYREDQIRGEIGAGLTLSEALKQFGHV
jgi:4-hydroxy-4-methyl-2-oxoglutarate aldolase